MASVVLGLAIAMTVLMAFSMYRLVAGPTVYDRMVGVGIIGTKSLLLLALIGYLYERSEMFVDLAVVYGLLNFIGAVALAKYFERRRER